MAPLVGCVRQSAPSPSDLTPLAKLADLPEGGALRVKLGDEPVLVVNHGGTVRALSGLCTHEGCELGWNQEQQLIRCPCHGSAFDPNGRAVKGPAVDPLPPIPIEIRNGTVFAKGGPGSA